MKENKITRKIKRLEIINDLVNSLQETIQDIEIMKTTSEERIQEELQKNEEERDRWTLTWVQEQIESNQIKLDEARKLLAELEKMA